MINSEIQPADFPVSSRRYSVENGWSEAPTRIIREASVALTVNGEVWLSFLCTPLELDALALGFLYNEGIIQSLGDVNELRVCPAGDNVDVWLKKPVEPPRRWKKTSGCSGGLTTGEAAPPPPPAGEPLPASALLNGVQLLLESQVLYRETRGIHASILTDGQTILARAEDIGRHNTIDKLAGMLLRAPTESRRRILVTTGRVSSEMMQKSMRLGAQAVVSHTSPTSESVRLAESGGVTLAGYARRAQMIVYTHSERLT